MSPTVGFNATYSEPLRTALRLISRPLQIRFMPLLSKKHGVFKSRDKIITRSGYFEHVQFDNKQKTMCGNSTRHLLIRTTSDSSSLAHNALICCPSNYINAIYGDVQ